MKKYVLLFLKESIFTWIIGVLTVLALVASEYLLSNVLDSIITLNLVSFLRSISIVCIGYVIVFTSKYLQEIIRTKTVQRQLQAIREDIADRIKNAKYTAFHKRHSADYVSWFEGDLNLIEQKALVPIMLIVISIAKFALSFAALFLIHWQIALAASVGGFILLLFPKLFEKAINDKTNRYSKMVGAFVTKIEDTLSGFDALFSFNRRALITEEVTKNGKNRAKEFTSLANIHILSALCAALIGYFFYISILALTGYLAIKNVINVGAVLATQTISKMLVDSLKESSGYFLQINSCKSLFKKFEEIETVKETSLKLLQVPSFRDKISIENLSFTYEGAKRPSLSNVNMCFEIGEKYGIIGESGSGKTTLFKLLSGMLEGYEGAIYYDGAELAEINKETLREKVAYIDQSVYLFNKTIRQNISLEKDFTDEEFDKALEGAALKSVISKLQGGIDTMVEQNGSNFSGGQRQRIALARALIYGRKIVFIDEGTSALDEQNAKEIESRLLKNSSLTVVMVSHHFSEETKGELDKIYTL